MTNYSFIPKAYKNEIKFCMCGCNNQIKWRNSFKYNGWAKYCNYHASHLRKGKTVIEIYGRPIKIKKPLIERVCLCGCNEKFLVKNFCKKRFKFGHYARVQVQKGKSKEEFYGKEKATQMIERSRNKQKGISWEIRYGLENAQKRRTHFLKIIAPYFGRPGRNEKLILDIIEKKMNIKLLRNVWIAGKFVDGFDKEKNIVYEIDEPHHFYKKYQLKDKEREQKIKKAINCQIIRINEQQFLNEYNNKKLSEVGKNI